MFSGIAFLHIHLLISKYRLELIQRIRLDCLSIIMKISNQRTDLHLTGKMAMIISPFEGYL